MKTSTILEIDDLSFELFPLRLIDSLQLSKQHQKENFFEFLKIYLNSTTSLDTQQIEELTLQTALAIAIYHRFYFWDNEEVAVGLTPKDFLVDRPFEEKIVTFDGFRYTNKLTIKNLIKAESLCYLNKEQDFLGIYIIAAGCLKGLKVGVEKLLFEIDSNELAQILLELNNNIRENGNCRVDLLFDTSTVNILSYNNKALDLIKSSFFLHFLHRNM